LIDHVEGLFEFLNLRLIEHCKHVRSGSLSSLLGGLLRLGFAGHFLFLFWGDYPFSIESTRDQNKESDITLIRIWDGYTPSVSKPNMEDSNLPIEFPSEPKNSHFASYSQAAQ